MRNLFRHIRENPFIFAAGLAAFIHSVWTLDVMFAGPEIPFAADPLNASFRKLVAGFIAISIDIGQIQTSIEIREGQKNRTKYVAFFSFAAATYFLQWVYMTHHIPVLEMGGGVRAEWLGAVRFLLDCSVWIIPGLLPASTLLYTFSQAADKTLVTLEGGIQVLVDKDHAQALNGGGSAPVPALPVPNKGRKSLAANAGNKQPANARSETRAVERTGYPTPDASNPDQSDVAENDSAESTQGGGYLPDDQPAAPPTDQNRGNDQAGTFGAKLALIVASGVNPAQGVFQMGDTWSVVCPDCKWTREGYKSESNARGGLKGHAPYCKAVNRSSSLWNKDTLDRLPQGYDASQLGYPSGQINADLDLQNPQ